MLSEVSSLGSLSAPPYYPLPTNPLPSGTISHTSPTPHTQSERVRESKREMEGVMVWVAAALQLESSAIIVHILCHTISTSTSTLDKAAKLRRQTQEAQTRFTHRCQDLLTRVMCNGENEERERESER